jgi:hypothetical protein
MNLGTYDSQPIEKWHEIRFSPGAHGLQELRRSDGRPVSFPASISGEIGCLLACRGLQASTGAPPPGGSVSVTGALAQVAPGCAGL